MLNKIWKKIKRTKKELRSNEIATFDVSNISVEKEAFVECSNTPYNESDYDDTIFCGQRKIFVESDEENYYLDYQKAIALLKEFCCDRIYAHGVRIEHAQNRVHAGWAETHYHYHDGYEYDKGADINIRRIEEKEYYTTLQNLQIKSSKYGYLDSACEKIQGNSSEAFLRSLEEDDTSCEMIFCAKNLLGLIGYFEIIEKHWNTM